MPNSQTTHTATAPKSKAKTSSTTAPKSATRKRAPASPDAIALLRKDHAEVKALFEQYAALVEAKAPAAKRKGIATTVCALLTVHATIEEEIFYPAAREALSEDDLIDEADVEHASAKDLIAQIEGMEPTEPLYDAKVTVLGEYIDHHVKEEQNEMFPKCRKAGMDLKALGLALKNRKDALMSERGLTPH